MYDDSLNTTNVKTIAIGIVTTIVAIATAIVIANATDDGNAEYTERVKACLEAGGEYRPYDTIPCNVPGVGD